MKNPEINDFKDWRLETHFFAAEDNTLFGIKKDTDMTAGSSYTYEDHKLAFFLPSGTALFLEFALEQYGIALRWRQKALSEVYKGAIKNQNLFQFFESLSASFIFSMVALEAFANTSIPDGFFHEEKFRKIWKALGKETIERNVDFETKIGDILPKIYEVQTIKGTQAWTDFLEMKEIRDRLTHFKSKERHSLHPTHDSIWDDLLKMQFKSPIKTTYSIIEHHIKADIMKQPWWFKNVPEGFKTS